MWDLNGYLSEKEIKRIKSYATTQGLQCKIFYKDRESIMKRHSPVMDAITFRFLISLTVQGKLDIQLMDVVTVSIW